MVNLEGKNLCERHKELNFKVIEAAKNKVDLQEVKCADNSDIDRIFKIDLASKYKNVEYLLEELKSGDSLYASRALKCEWLYASDNAHSINPYYLHHHIFPTMSLKMKNKTLSAISIYVRDETRAQLFYMYCMNTEKWDSALKFLLFTSESFKNELMNDRTRFFDLCFKVKIGYLRKFIGNSFTLADSFGKMETPIIELSYLYSLNEEEYLNLLEKHARAPLYKKLFGVKMSRSILKKHKDRILKYPLLYLSILNQSELLKYSSSEDAQVYAAALLPDRADQFWYGNYFNRNKPILELIKPPSMFEYLKKLFTDKYKTSEFEMTKEFYRYNYYNVMTSEEREAWALNHVQKQLDVLPEDESYNWYEFIAFKEAFKEIKTQIYITTDTNKRSEMLVILVISAKTQRDLEELLNYYYKRHVNETKDKKTYFIRRVMLQHKVLEFDDTCWVAFDLLLHSLDVYNTSTRWGYDDVLTVSLIYHIINNKTLSENLQTYLKHYFSTYHFRPFFDQLNDDKKDLVYNYMNQFLISIILEFESQEYSDAVKNEIRVYLLRFPELRRVFDKKDEYPEIVIKYMKLDLENFKYIVEPEETEITEETEVPITEGYLLRCLKEDASLIVEKLPLIKDRYNYSRRFRINMLLRKIALFFSNDIAKQFLDFFTKTLYESIPNNAIEEQQTICSIVFAIFQMGDQKCKTELMDKFTPTNPKIEHDKIGHYVLYTQQAICRFQCYSRPPMPLSKTALFLKGDYVHKCDDMFNRYLANLPPALRTEFIKLLLDSPLSIQKRGLRLAFKTFEASELKDLVSSIWKKTKNVSLRQILYLSLLDKMVKEEGKAQEVLYELLEELTLTIHQDDTDEVFACFSDNRIPSNFRGSYLQTAWKVVGALPQKKTNLERVTRVIRSVASNMFFMDGEFLTGLISDHVQLILCEQKLRPQENRDLGSVNDAMWDLIALYIVDIPNETKQESSLKLVEAITKECLDNWKEDHDTEYLIFQGFFRRFVGSLIQHSSYFDTKYLGVVHIFEYLLQTFENKFEISEMYTYFWDWKLDLLMRKVINGKSYCDKEDFINFGLQLGVLVKELKSKNLYYITFFNSFYGKISGFINLLNHRKRSTFNRGNTNILIAYGVTLTEMFETYALALNIMPTYPSEGMEAEYFDVIKKIKKQNNAELTALLNDRLIYSDLKVREFYK